MSDERVGNPAAEQPPVARHANDNNELTGGVYIVLTAICWGTVGVVYKFLAWPPLLLGFFRGALSYLVYVIYRRSFKVRVNRSTLIGAALTFTTATLFTAANGLTTAANAITLQYTNPIFVMLIVCVMHRRRPQAGELVTAAMVMGGVVLFFLDDLSRGNTLGNLLALASGVLMAVSNVFARYTKEDTVDYYMLGALFSAAVGLPQLFTANADYSPAKLAAVLFMGVVSIGLPGILFSKGIKRISPIKSSSLLMLDPLTSALLAALLIGERPGVTAIIGGLLVLSGVAFGFKAKMSA